VNVSLRPAGEKAFGTKVEVKNLNSFRSVFRALEYEIARQAGLLERGERVRQETRGWLEDRGVTVLQRSKEEAHDYRYFPEPDLPPLFMDRDWVARLRAVLPDLPDARRERYVASHGLSAYDAELLATDAATATFFDAVVAEGADAKKAANWVLNDLARLRADGETDGQLTPAYLAELIKLVDVGTVSSSAAKQVLEASYRGGKQPSALVDELGLGQVSDTTALEAAVREVLAAQPAAVADYRAGKTGAINFLKGQVMKATRGKANPAVAEALLLRLLA
jgi:aspartyl-tRNA(Asn)/glutamyl-tRNA(Gln) amidotransferase subunit B